jgi:hypothetical protein
MGREPGVWDDKRIFSDVTLPWLELQAGIPASKGQH